MLFFERDMMAKEKKETKKKELTVDERMKKRLEERCKS